MVIVFLIFGEIERDPISKRVTETLRTHRKKGCQVSGEMANNRDNLMSVARKSLIFLMMDQQKRRLHKKWDDVAKSL